MFYFKNKYESQFNKEAKNIPGLSKYWRYSTLDSQNNNNLYSSYDNPTIQNINNNENTKSPNDITIEVSYDNFYVMGVDMMKKKKYAEELRAQIEEKKYIKKLEEEKRRLDEIKDDLRIEKERKIIEEREKENNKRLIPKINLMPLQKKEPIKVITPPMVMPSKLTTKFKTPKKIIKKNYIYRKKYNNDEIINYLRERERNLERFNTEINEQINGIKNDFNLGMRKIHFEIEQINNKNYKKVKFDNLIDDIRNIKNNKKNNIEIQHIFSILRKNKDGKFSIQQFNNDFLPNSSFDIKILNNFNDNYFEQSSNSFPKLPYINLSHQITYK